MTERLNAKVLIVGGGPGGYVAAIRCGQLGLDTVLVETDRLGGTCLIRGCIPSKALIHAASTFADLTGRDARMGIALAAPPSIDLAKTVAWKDGIVGKLSGGVAGLLKRAKVRVVPGWGRFLDGKTCEVTAGGEATTRISGEHVILATGSLAAGLPFLPFGGDVISSSEALDLTEIPRRLAVVGAGYIGLELGTAFRKLGSEVTVVEATDRILPGFDAELAAPVGRWLKSAGVAVHLNAKASGFEAGALKAIDAAGGPLSIAADKVLVTVGRKPKTEGWGRENLALDMAGPFIKVDETCATSMRNVWAVGDVTGEPMLEHRAAAQGEMVAEIIAGHRRRFDPAAIAAVCFTEPEIAVCGLSPDEARATGAEILTGLFPFAANGRARSMEAADEGGFVRVVARADDHRVLGLAAVGAHVSDLSGEFALALEMGAVLEDLAGTIHVHPTLTEAVHEAALKALGHAIHI